MILKFKKTDVNMFSLNVQKYLDKNNVLDVVKYNRKLVLWLWKISNNYEILGNDKNWCKYRFRNILISKIPFKKNFYFYCSYCVCFTLDTQHAGSVNKHEITKATLILKKVMPRCINGPRLHKKFSHLYNFSKISEIVFISN